MTSSVSRSDNDLATLGLSSPLGGMMLLSFTSPAMFVKLTTRIDHAARPRAVLELYGRILSAQRATRRAFSQPEIDTGGCLYVNGSHVMNGNSAPASVELKNLSRVSSLKTQT